MTYLLVLLMFSYRAGAISETFKYSTLEECEYARIYLNTIEELHNFYKANTLITFCIKVDKE